MARVCYGWVVGEVGWAFFFFFWFFFFSGERLLSRVEILVLYRDFSGEILLVVTLLCMKGLYILPTNHGMLSICFFFLFMGSLIDLLQRSLLMFIVFYYLVCIQVYNTFFSFFFFFFCAACFFFLFLLFLCCLFFVLFL